MGLTFRRGMGMGNLTQGSSGTPETGRLRRRFYEGASSPSGVHRCVCVCVSSA